jgi:hypothetical protein
VLRRRLVQLHFPIAPGVSASEAYRAATRRGVLPDGGPADGVRFSRPDLLRLFLHPTPAGRVPVVVAGARDDVVALVRALTRRNEPEPVPAAVGACMVAGYTNWDRVAAHRREWTAANPHDDGTGWDAEYRRVAADPARHQDRFILLSAGPYSAVPASALGLGDDAWLGLSLTIRLEHECAHYFTKRALGAMRSALLDELIADYAGIVAGVGEFRAPWLLRFMGLAAFPESRPGGRLESYRGTPPLGDGAFRVLQCALVAAAANLERFDRRCGAALRARPFGTVRAIRALARVGIEAAAARGGDAALEAALDG